MEKHTGQYLANEMFIDASFMLSTDGISKKEGESNIEIAFNTKMQ